MFTQTSGGNTAAAVFNSAVSNILGVFLSPLLLSILIRQGGRGLPAAQLASILAGIGLRMLLPLAVGQLARIPLRAWASRRSGLLAAISNLLILLLIYLAAASAPLIVALAYGGARIVGLKRADVITACLAGDVPQRAPAHAPGLTQHGAVCIIASPVEQEEQWQKAIAGRD